MDTVTQVSIPFTSEVLCRLQQPESPRPGPPPLLVVLHGQGQSAERQQRWMGAAVPAHFAAAFPDGLHPFEVRRPERKVRIGRAWYLYTPDDREAFFASLQTGSETLWSLINKAADALGADKRRIWLAGFSQGAYMTHYLALRHLDQVPGWISQAGGFREEYAGDPFPDASGHRVLIQHGRQDEAIGLEVAESTAELLGNHGAQVTVRHYDAGHVILPQMADDVRSWLQQHQPPS